MKVQDASADIGLPAMSVIPPAPPFIRMVYCDENLSDSVGVSVIRRFGWLYPTVASTRELDASLSSTVEDETELALIGSLKVALTEDSGSTSIAPAIGIWLLTTGGVLSSSNSSVKTGSTR